MILSYLCESEFPNLKNGGDDSNYLGRGHEHLDVIIHAYAYDLAQTQQIPTIIIL